MSEDENRTFAAVGKFFFVFPFHKHHPRKNFACSFVFFCFTFFLLLLIISIPGSYRLYLSRFEVHHHWLINCRKLHVSSHLTYSAKPKTKITVDLYGFIIALFQKLSWYYYLSRGGMLCVTLVWWMRIRTRSQFKSISFSDAERKRRNQNPSSQNPNRIKNESTHTTTKKKG